MGAAEVYTDELTEQFEFLATWPPSMQLSVGTIGTMDGRVFVPISHLTNYGLDVPVIDDTTKSDVLAYSSKGVTSIGVSAGAEVPEVGGGVATVGAKIDVSFARSHAVVFRASGLVARRAADEPALARQLVWLLDQGVWDRRWQIVTHTIQAEDLTVLISNSSDSKVELAADATVGPTSGIDLLDASLGARILSQSEMHTVLMSSTPVTPLFRSKRVRRTFFSRRPELRAGWAADLGGLDAQRDDLDDQLLERVTDYGYDEDDDAQR